MLPAVGRSIAATRWSRVDLPEPDGPISATKSLLAMRRVTSFNATTWNSSRTYSLVRLSVSMTISLIGSTLPVHGVAVLQSRGRAENHVFTADQAFFDADVLPAHGAGLHRAAHRLVVEQHEYRPI